MATLIEILNLPHFAALTAAQPCLDALNTTQSLPGDSTPYTWSGIGQKLIENGASVSDYESFMQNVDTLPGGIALDKCLSSGGFDFSNEFNRATITSQEMNEPDWAVKILDAMLAIGAPISVPTWQVLGLSVQPQLADITAARQQIATAAWCATAINEIINPMMGTSDVPTILAALTALPAV